MINLYKCCWRKYEKGLFNTMYYFGLGIGIALICIFYFTSLQTIQIEYGNDEIVIKEEGYNLEEVIQLDEVKEIEYIEMMFYYTILLKLEVQ